jgi:hypothetical protein
MPVVAQICTALDIRVHEYSGVIGPGDLFQLAAFYRQHPQFVHADVISFVDETATGADSLLSQLETLRIEFRRLHASSQLPLARRSAWVCPNVAAWRLLEDFLGQRHSRDSQGTEICLVASLSEVDCLFEPDELRAVETRDGFQELYRIGNANPDQASVRRSA